METKHNRRYARPFACSALLFVALASGAWSVAVVAGDDKAHDAKGMSKEAFERADGDGDGRLNREDYRSMKDEKSSSATNESGGEGLPATEHQSDAVRDFDDLDSDGDDHVSADELSDAQSMDRSMDSPRTPMPER